MRHRLARLCLDIFIILIISVAISVARFSYRLYKQRSLRLSCHDEFRLIHLGEPRDLTQARLQHSRIPCQPPVSESTCQFSDPWHIYIVGFDKERKVSQKSMRYRTSRMY
jgi:hypothetical protein